MSVRAIFRLITMTDILILTLAKSVTPAPNNPISHKPVSHKPVSHKPVTHKVGHTETQLHQTTFDPEEFRCDEVDPEVRKLIDPHYNESDFDKVIFADGQNVTVLYDREKEIEETHPEVKKILDEMKNEDNSMYYPTEVNYFNQTIDHFINKTADELKFLQERNQIYPDLVEKPADRIVQVAYRKEAVAFGNEIRAKSTIRAPTFVSWPVEKDSQYCLIMTDPDTSLHTKVQAREYQHWIVVNIPGTNLTAGEEITEYVRPHPEYNTGFHRFIFYVFKQNEKDKIYDEIKLSHIPVKSLRKEFSTKHFAAKNNLTGPVAINFFIACWDKEVDEIDDML